MESVVSLLSHQKPLQPSSRESHYFPGNLIRTRKPPAEFIELNKEFSSPVGRESIPPRGVESPRMDNSRYNRCPPPMAGDVDVLGDADKGHVNDREEESSYANTFISTSSPWKMKQLGINRSGWNRVEYVSNTTGGEGASGDSSGGEQSKGSGRREKSGSESSNSSSRRSGSARSSGERGGNIRNGSSGSGDDGDRDDEKKHGDYSNRGSHDGGESGGSKGPPTKKTPKQQEEEDESTDSADEGGGDDDDTPTGMSMAFHSPPAQTTHRSGGEGVLDPNNARGQPGQFPGGGFIVGRGSIADISNGRGLQRGLNSGVSISNHFEGKAGGLNSSSPLCLPLSMSVPSPPQLQSAVSNRSGTVAVETMATMESGAVEPSGNAVSMIVGYGVPAASAPPPQGSDNKSLPGSELGTPTQDSPSPLAEEMPIAMPMTVTPMTATAMTAMTMTATPMTATPMTATPMTATPLMSPGLSLLPQVIIML